MNKKKYLALITATCLALAVTGGPAKASLQIPQNSNTISGINSDCVASLSTDTSSLTPQEVTDQCSYKVTLEVSAQTPLTKSAAIKVNNMFAASSAPIYSIQWTQSYVSLNFKEVHNGTAYYDGTYAWSTNTTRGVTGTHYCHQSGSYVKLGATGNFQCTATPSPSRASIVDRESYDVYAIAQGIPIFSYTAAFSVLINCNGLLTERAY